MFSFQWEYRIRVSHMHHPVEFRHFRSAATCYGMRQSSVYSLRVEDWMMLLFGGFFPLPCLRAPGRGVPGFLAGPALVFCCCFSSMIQTLSFVIFTRMSHVSQCTKGSAPIRESCTDFSPLISRWWTNRTRLHGPIGLRAKKNEKPRTYFLEKHSKEKQYLRK